MFCIPIIAKDTDEALQKMAYAKDLTDIFEIRLDLMETFNIYSIIQASPKPVLVTYRSKAEGGKGQADFPKIADYSLDAIQAGAALVDVELNMPEPLRQKIMDSKKSSQIVISTHINDHTPSRLELQSIFKKSIATGADIIKVVTLAVNWSDNLRVLDLVAQALDNGIKIIAFCMGPRGRISRVFSNLMGAHLTFVTLDVGQESAAGQIPIQEMKKILEYFLISSAKPNND
jgi:3-dehydroquinate dehydratase type I